MHKIVNFTFDEKLSERVERAVERAATCVRVDPTSSTAEGLIKTFDPDLIVVDAGRGLSSGAGGINELMKTLRHNFNGRPIVAIGDEFSAQAVLSAMRAGATDFIERDGDLEEIRSQLTSHLTNRQRSVDKGTQAPLTVIMSGLADEHEPHLALNIGVHLAGEDKPGDVVLVDLTLPASEAAIGLGIKTSYTIREVLLDMPRLDRLLLTTALARHEGSGLYLLPLAVGGEDVSDLRPSDIIAIIFLLRGMFREVVLSIGFLRHSPALAHLLPTASSVLVVTSQHFDSVKACSDIFHRRAHAGAIDERYQLVVAEYDTDIEVDEDQIREVLGMENSHTIPASRAHLINCFNSGQPIITAKPNSPYSQAVRAIVAACRGEGRPRRRTGGRWSITRLIDRIQMLL